MCKLGTTKVLEQSLAEVHNEELLSLTLFLDSLFFTKFFIYQIYFIDFLERCKDYAITDLVSTKNYHTYIYMKSAVPFHALQFP